MKSDINTRNDIEALITHFYEKVKPNAEIGFIFTDIVHINWEHHIPVIVDFWETILLDNPVYTKNAMEVHYDLNNRITLTKIHFETWLSLFNASVNELYEGKTASMAKTRAQSIAAVMQFKMEGFNNKKSPQG